MSAVHPNDQLYALDRAIAACLATGEAPNVISDLRSLREEVQRHVRAGGTGSGLNLPATSTGD